MNIQSLEFVETEQSKALEKRVFEMISSIYMSGGVNTILLCSSNRNEAISNWVEFMRTFTKDESSRALQSKIMHFLKGDDWIIGPAKESKISGLVSLGAGKTHKDIDSIMLKAGNNLSDVALAPDGYHVYKAGSYRFADSIEAFKIASENGQLRRMVGSVFADEVTLSIRDLWF